MISARRLRPLAMVLSLLAPLGLSSASAVTDTDLRDYAERAMRQLQPVVEEESLFGGAILFVRSEVGNRNSGGTQIDEAMVLNDMDYSTGITGFDVFQGQWGSRGIEFNFSRLAIEAYTGAVFYAGMTNGNIAGGDGGGFDAFVTKVAPDTLEFLPFRTASANANGDGCQIAGQPPSAAGCIALGVYGSILLGLCRRARTRAGRGREPGDQLLLRTSGLRAGRIAVPLTMLLAACGGEQHSSRVETFSLGAILRTPDERFADLPDYPFPPHYAQAGPVRIHYVDEGPPDAPVVLLLHGQPSWSYLYRRMIPILAGAGFRVIAPDLVGFGRSDKPIERSDYTYDRHTEWMRFLLEEHLDLRGVTMFLQDWGGLIGLRLAAASPDRYERMVLANTGLPEGEGEATPAFLAFRDFVASSPLLPVGTMIGRSATRTLTPAEIAAYDAPFPDESFKGGARSFPALVPIDPGNPGVPAARATWASLERWAKPVVTAFSDGDPITRGGEAVFQTRIPGARNQPHVTIRNAGHFLQEDASEELARLLVDLHGSFGAGASPR